jgi:transferase CAF17, mitochondrial
MASNAAAAAAAASRIGGSSSSSKKVWGSFGRLWGRGYEHLVDRTILQVHGPGATTYLQNLVTSDLLHPPTLPTPEAPDHVVPGVPKHLQKPPQQQQPSPEQEEQQQQPAVEFNLNLRPTCFLDPRGRIVSDAMLWKVSDELYYIDAPASSGEVLKQHLNQYKLRRSKVDIHESLTASSYVIYGTLQSQGTPDGLLAGLDPRHPSLGLRVLQLDNSSNSNNINFADRLKAGFPSMPGNHALVRRLAGIAEGHAEIGGLVALETNQEHLQAVSFRKGCYLGQELTARVHHTGVLRKRIVPILLTDTASQVPNPWAVSHSLQEGRYRKKFTRDELERLPPRLPRLSVATAGSFVAITTGSVDPDGEFADAEAESEYLTMQQRSQEFLSVLDENCRVGTKMYDKDGQTVGQIVADPIPGTNVVLALMRLSSIGLQNGGTTFDKTNKITVDNVVVRMLPYLPLWWPELDMATGKAKEEGSGYESEARSPDEDTASSSATPPPLTKIHVEDISHPTKEDAPDAVEAKEEKTQ